MKNQARLRLRQVGKHHGDPMPWLTKFNLRTSRMNAFEHNVWPRHYTDDEPTPPSYTVMANYLTGAVAYHFPATVYIER